MMALLISDFDWGENSEETCWVGLATTSAIAVHAVGAVDAVDAIDPDERENIRV